MAIKKNQVNFRENMCGSHFIRSVPKKKTILFLNTEIKLIQWEYVFS